ncbi:hypothetical protein N7468_006793 [Penicillium chermesinum]|uniref:GPI mannosyltransferase 2 n=1 Tax=Penicillium chermesinum TaxID=63820 RepID=A0A9W9NT90_9EURO|nr:uncharacterized protein N7468_006793 [Penicillium chermesinum]KAJ5225568.1 hypothetical protein N7468_006793 [Penicillium chermesinum]
MASSPRRPISASLLRLDNPIRSLTLAFLVWKPLVFIAVVACPGSGYDTSTALIHHENARLTTSLPWQLKFARWDSIYFLHTAENGYVFEQEWAFGFPRVLGLFVSGIRRSGGTGGPYYNCIGGHCLVPCRALPVCGSLVLALGQYFRSCDISSEVNLFPVGRLAYYLSRGAFLSAPYGESTFSFLNISGFYLYSCSLIAEQNGGAALRDVYILGAALLFAIATTVRSNGLLSGFLFAYDVLFLSWVILTQGPSVKSVRRLLVTGIGGATVAMGTLIPQVIAYRAYCLTETDLRPWCTWTLPSIYTWVQGFYWNVGFLRYWTISNVPLFLVAAPVLTLMVVSSLWALQTPPSLGLEPGKQSPSPLTPGSMLFRLAVPQGLLAVLAMTSYHVQIVNRICSGYPVFYWYLASNAMDSLKDYRKGHRNLTVTAQAMVGYALIQAVLFGSFLPPA